MKKKPTITNSLLLEIASDMAEIPTKQICETENTPYETTEPNGDVRLTEEAQNIFNGFLESFEQVLTNYFSIKQ